MSHCSLHFSAFSFFTGPIYRYSAETLGLIIDIGEIKMKLI